MINLKQKAAFGFVWMALQKYSSMLVLFVSDMVLARLVMLAASIASAAICFFLVEYFHFNLYFDGVLKLLLFGILYMVWSVVLKFESYEYSKTIVRPMVSKIIKKKK